MKAIIKYTALMLGLVLAASCTQVDYPDRFVQTAGVPKVDFVRYGDKDVIITQAAMSEIVCLVGENLTSIHDLYFNDQAAVLNTSYMTAKTLMVQVPKTQPKEETDKIYMITKDSTVVAYDFKVLPPVPKISGMSLEWAQPGETVTIYGSYLFAPVTVEFPGSDPVEATASDGESVTLKVPADAQPGKIKVTTSSGTAQSVFQYKDSRGMLFDFDGLTGLDKHGWNAHSSQDADEWSISGRYFQFGDGVVELTGSWEESQYSFPYWPGSWNEIENYWDGDWYTPRLCDIVDFSDWKNMALKFEMCIPASNPWNNTPMQIVFGGVDIISYGAISTDIYGNQCAGQNNTYMDGSDGWPMGPRVFYQPWESTGSFDTGGKWITVSIPLTDVTKDWNGKDVDSEIKASTFASVWFFICNGGVSYPEASCTPIIKVDNIRAVPIR